MFILINIYYGFLNLNLQLLKKKLNLLNYEIKQSNNKNCNRQNV